MTSLSLHDIARAVGGTVCGRDIRVVWPGKDRTKVGGVVIRRADNRYGFVVNSFYSDVSPSDAFEFIRSRLVKWTRFLGPGVKLESGRSV
jgi:hypothetical protein